MSLGKFDAPTSNNKVANIHNTMEDNLIRRSANSALASDKTSQDQFINMEGGSFIEDKSGRSNLKNLLNKSIKSQMNKSYPLYLMLQLIEVTMD